MKLTKDVIKNEKEKYHADRKRHTTESFNVNGGRSPDRHRDQAIEVDHFTQLASDQDVLQAENKSENCETNPVIHMQVSVKLT